MLHRCQECGITYLISDNAGICNGCAEYLRRRIEQLHETDDAIEWWRICSWAMTGEINELDQSRTQSR